MTQVLTREDAARAAAERVKDLADIHMPRLDLWNYDSVCKAHAERGETKPVTSCEYQECGGDLWGAQRVGVTWLYLRKDGLLADDPGVGKWVQMIHLVCLLKQRGELPRRALFVVATPSLGQCVEQTRRWAPGLSFEYVTGKMGKSGRVERYASAGWDLLIVGHHVARGDRKVLEQLGPFSLFFSDDVDELLDPRNVTHRAIVSLSNLSERAVVGNATNLQTRLEQLIAASMACRGGTVFGTMTQASKRYIRREQVPIYVKGGVRRKVTKVTGYKNLGEFREKLQPMYLRRRLEDLGVDVPELLPPATEWLELSARQQRLYDELRSGALKLRNSAGVEYNAAKAIFLSGQRICAGLPALGEPDGPGASPKLDWLFDRLKGVWQDRKVVCYMVNRGMVEATARRAHAAGIGWAVIWGGQTPEVRSRHTQRFMREDNCRLMIGNKSLERSHNLQAASVLVAIDTQLNPARMRQLLGRVRRAGSAHQHVQMITLLMGGTQEEGYLEILRRRAALSDYVFDESTGAEMYGALSSFELLELVVGR